MKIFERMLPTLQTFKTSSACKNSGRTATDVLEQRVRTAPFIFGSRHPLANIVRIKHLPVIFAAVDLSNTDILRAVPLAHAHEW